VVKKATVAKTKPGTPFWAALVIILVGGVAALGYLANRGSDVVIAMDPTLPPVTAKGYELGKPDAPVHIIEFGDYECPACGQYATVTEPDVRTRLVETGIVRLTYMDFPLDIHKNTWYAAMTAACANDQGKYWEMHARLYEGQNDWNGQATRNPTPVLTGYVKELGLDVKQWEACYTGKKHLADIQAMRKEAELRKFQGTPAFIIGDDVIPGAPSYDQIKRLVDKELAKQKGAAPAPEAKKAG
jgi:protein-disulfide isomerase